LLDHEAKYHLGVQEFDFAGDNASPEAAS